MAITPSDFSKIWASNADTLEYTFSDADYLKGWDFVGNLPPTRAQWNAIQKNTDEKMKYVFDNFGAPLTVSTVAEMTMQNRVYVYTGSETGYTAGHWYYWNGSAWTDGGVYNSNTVQVDPTLTISGAAADAKVTGDKFAFVSGAIYTDYQNTTWAVGSFFPSFGGDDNSLTTRIRTGYISEDIKKISVKTGYKYMLLAWQQDDTYVGVWHGGTSFVKSGRWMTDPVELDQIFSNYKIKLLLAKTSDADIVVSDASNIILSTFINRQVPNKSVNYDSLADELSGNCTPGMYTEQNISYLPTQQYVRCTDGAIVSAEGLEYYTSDFIDCSNIPYIRYTGSASYSACCVAFYDKQKNFIRAYPSVSSSINYWREEFPVPSDAKYVIFGNNSGITGKLSVSIAYMEYYATKLNRKWVGKKWACVGDSLTEINSRASMRYMDYIRDTTGIVPYNMGKSGTGYANGRLSNNSFLDRIVNVPTDSDVVTIFGSFNDVFSSNPIPLGDITDTGDTTLCGYINNTITALYTVFPEAQLGIITPCPWENANPSDSASLASNYVQALVNICKRRGIACLDLFHCSGMRPWESGYREIYYTNDEGIGVHPNNLGHKIIAAHIGAFLDTLVI